MNNYVLVTYFTINIKFIFVQMCLMGNVLSQYFLKGSHCQNSMLYGLMTYILPKNEKYMLYQLFDSSISVALGCLGS